MVFGRKVFGCRQTQIRSGRKRPEKCENLFALWLRSRPLWERCNHATIPMINISLYISTVYKY